MQGIKSGVKKRRVRRSVIRRTIVGSLVVMLSPFLTVLEHDADAAVLHRTPIIYHSAPAQQPAPTPAIRLLPAPSSEIYQTMASIRSDIRMAASATWTP